MEQGQLIGAIDQGTTSTRFILYDHELKQVAIHQTEHEQIYPQAGWVEHDPEEIFQNVCQCIDTTLQKYRDSTAIEVDSNQVVAIGITNQRETAVAWHRDTGRPLHHAIVWMDTRTADLCDDLARGLGGGKDHFRSTTGLPISTYFSAMKWRWMIDNVPSVREACESGQVMFGTIDSWLLYCLTGGKDGGLHIIDATNASRTLLMDLETRTWSSDICQQIGIPLNALPRIVPSAAKYGRLKCTALKDVVLSGCIGDQQSATLGQRCKVGQGKSTMGTGCFVLMNVGSNPAPSKNGLLSTLLFEDGSDTGRADAAGNDDTPNQQQQQHTLGSSATYGLEGSIAIAGAGVRWLRDNLGVIGSSEEVEPLAGGVQDCGGALQRPGVVFVPAFCGLFTPYWDNDARGTILGITQYTTKGHIARALLESICYQTYEVLEAMEKDSGIKLDTLRVDGGASANNLLLKMQADIIGMTVRRPADLETTALGAALAAGVGINLWTYNSVLDNEQDVHVFTPEMNGSKRESAIWRWKEAVKVSIAWGTPH